MIFPVHPCTAYYGGSRLKYCLKRYWPREDWKDLPCRGITGRCNWFSHGNKKEEVQLDNDRPA